METFSGCISRTTILKIDSNLNIHENILPTPNSIWKYFNCLEYRPRRESSKSEKLNVLTGAERGVAHSD